MRLETPQHPHPSHSHCPPLQATWRLPDRTVFIENGSMILVHVFEEWTCVH